MSFRVSIKCLPQSIALCEFAYKCGAVPANAPTHRFAPEFYLLSRRVIEHSIKTDAPGVPDSGDRSILIKPDRLEYNNLPIPPAPVVHACFAKERNNEIWRLVMAVIPPGCVGGLWSCFRAFDGLTPLFIGFLTIGRG